MDVKPQRRLSGNVHPYVSLNTSEMENPRRRPMTASEALFQTPGEDSHCGIQQRDQQPGVRVGGTEGVLGEGGGSARVSQGDYRGEEGWEIEVCNWLPGED